MTIIFAHTDTHMGAVNKKDTPSTPLTPLDSSPPYLWGSGFNRLTPPPPPPPPPPRAPVY